MEGRERRGGWCFGGEVREGLSRESQIAPFVFLIMNLRSLAAGSWLLRASRWFHRALNEFEACGSSIWVNLS